MGLVYPLILIVNVLFVLFWMLMRRWYLLLSLGCILIGWGYVQRQVRMPASLQRHNPAADSAGLTVMTYNVRAFDLYGYLDTTHTRDIRGEVYRFVHGQQPDVLCVQEYHFADKRPKALRSVLDMAGIPYDSTRSLQSQVYGLVNGSGVVTVSRYPIVNRGILEFPGSGNMTIYTDIVRGADTFRVYNCHLHSFGLRKAETDLLDTISLGGVEEKTDFLIRIGHRMREGFLRRAAQVEQVADHVGQSPYPVVVCGDFNDVPASYTYRKLSHGLKDAFVTAGSGWGGTYTLRRFFPVRIDYILYSDQFRAVKYHSPDLDLSDHEPVVVKLGAGQ